MSLRYAKRVDNNHAEIRDALRKMGCEVRDVSSAGMGVLDLEVKRLGHYFAVEVKAPKGKLTKQQAERIYVDDYAVVIRSLDDCVLFVNDYNALRKKSVADALSVLRKKEKK